MNKLLLDESDYREITGGRDFFNDFIKPVLERRKKRVFLKPKKQPIPSNIRLAVWERDNFTCQYCGSRQNLSIDHIYPESKGGEATIENCQTLCRSCNSRKGAR